MNKRRKKLKRVHEPGHFHELTFSCYQNRPLLTDDSWCRELGRSIDQACLANHVQLHAFVFMPDHVHLLVYPTQPRPQLGRFLAMSKQPLSKYVKHDLARRQSCLLTELTIRERPGKTCFRFWQAGAGYDRNLYQPESVQASIDYIHMNPVKKGLCQQAEQWKWSSAKWHIREVDDDELPHITALAPEFLDRGGVQIPNM